MSLVLYNQTAYEFELIRSSGAQLAARAAKLCDPKVADGLDFDMWKFWEDRIPAGYACWGCSEFTATWLHEVVPGFYFPNEGLQGEDRERLIINLRSLYCLIRQGAFSEPRENPMVDALVQLFGAKNVYSSTKTELDYVVQLGQFVVAHEVIYSF